MKVLVCFKLVPDLDLLPDEDWVTDPGLKVDTGFVKSTLNCFDESALEMALKLFDEARSTTLPFCLSAVTIGDRKSDTFLKTLYALRFDKAIRIENHVDISMLPEVVAAVLSQYVTSHCEQDVVLMGRQSGIGDHAKTPLLAAEMLGWPCITQVTGINLHPGGGLSITNRVDGGILTQVVQPPCVLAVGNAANSYLRVPTLKDRLEYGKTPVEVLDMRGFGIYSRMMKSRKDCELIGLQKIDKKRKGLLIEGETPARKAQILYEEYLRERLEKL